MRFAGSLLLISFLALAGCSPKVVVEKVPVAVFTKLERPERPVRDEGEKLSLYFVRVLAYTEKLEAVIDNHNKYVKE